MNQKPYHPTQLAEDFATVLDTIPAISRLYSDPDATIEEVRALGVTYENGVPTNTRTLYRHIEQPKITQRVVNSLLLNGLEKTITYIEQVTSRVERRNQENRDIAELFSEATQPGVQVHDHNKYGAHYEITPSGRKPILPDCDGYYPGTHHSGTNN